MHISPETMLRRLLLFLISMPIMILFSGCGELEKREASYRSYAEAESRGAIAGGWLPAFIPTSSREIQERHDLDTNEIWVHFLFSRQETRFVVQSCEGIEENQVIFPRNGQVEAISWWSKELQGNSRENRHYKFYRCTHEIRLQGSSEKKKAFLAVEENNGGEAWYWVLS